MCISILCLYSFFPACNHKKGHVAEPEVPTSAMPLPAIFDAAKETTLRTMAGFSSEASLNNAAVAGIAKAMLQDIPPMPILSVRMEALFAKDVVTQAERETLFEKFHVVRSDKVVRGTVLKPDLPGNKKEQIIFYQTFLRLVLENMLTQYKTAIMNTLQQPAPTAYHLTDTDKAVLYYIAGFILRKVNQKRGLSADLGTAFMLPSGGMTDVPAEWTVRLDRGGLKYPSKGFYTLIEECDKAMDINYVTPTCLLKERVIEDMMDCAGVKVAWDTLCLSAGVTTAASMRSLEAVVTVFYTVKGFSVARKVRSTIDLQHRRNISLRHSLVN